MVLFGKETKTMKTTGYKHLNEKQRNVIELYLNEDAKLSSIAAEVNKDARTVSKEIKKHRYLYVCANAKNICGLQSSCKKTRLCNLCVAGKCKYCRVARCSDFCDDFQEYPQCSRVKQFPHVCNACASLKDCSLPKLFYKANHAQTQYLFNVSDHKQGPNLSDAQLAILDNIISKGVKNKQSIEVILHTSGLSTVASTVYDYINRGYLTVKNVDLKRKVVYKQRYTSKPKAKPINYDYLVGRSFKDFTQFILDHPTANVWQMDTIEGLKGQNEAAVLSLLHTKSNLQLYFLLKSISQEQVLQVFNTLKQALGDDLFRETFECILGDNGKEFRDPLSIETSLLTGEKLIPVFFCEARRSDQKAKCEKNHVHFRECVPKGKSMNFLTPKKLNSVSLQVNNYPRKSLQYHSPYQIASSLLNEKVLECNRLSFVPPIDVNLSSTI